MLDKELQKIADLFFRFFEPVISATESISDAQALMLELGYIPPKRFKVFEKIGGSVNTLKDIFTFLEGLTEGDIDADPELIVKTIEDLIEGIIKLMEDLKELPTVFESELSGSGLLAQTNILTEFLRKLVDYLIINYLRENNYRSYSFLRLFSIIEVNEILEVSNEYNNPHLEKIFHWERIGDIFSDPLGLLKTTLKNQDEYFYYQTLYALQAFGNSLGLIPHYRDPDLDVLKFINNNPTIEDWTGFDDLEILRFPLIPNDFDSVGIDVYPLIDTVNDKFTGLVLGLGVDPEQMEFTITDKLKLQLELSANANNGLGLSIDQNDEFKFIADLFSSPQNLSENIQLEFKAKLVAESNIVGNEEDKLFLIGTPKGNRFEIGSINLGFGVEKKQDVRLYIEIELLNGLIAINFSDADGFISKIIGEGIESNFNLGIGFSNKQGLYFTGSSALEISLPTHVDLGIIEIQNLLVSALSGEETISFEIGSTLLVNLGPIEITVENIGISFPDKKNNNLEKIAPKFGFKPPNGVGISIDADAVKGGGYLYFNYDKEEYVGVLELDLNGIVNVKAIGLITTKMPDGSKGFSLILIITAEFGSPIQLGLGFTLKSVGGLLGLNRSMRLQQIFTGIRDGGINSIMFPQNVIANAPRIISDLKNYFPVEEGTFLIGPMMKIGWGSPNIVTVTLGVIIEIPGDIAILGVLKVALPDEEAAVIVIQVNFMGAIEFDKKRLWFFATLYDSRVLFITLEGQMGLLVTWGEEPNFLISVGGFHPAFNPPALPFGLIKRISYSLLNTSFARIRIDSYFAVTSNSVQFGAKVEIFFGVSAFKIDGFLAYDALFLFSPFYFIISMSASLSVKVFGIGVFSVRIRGTLRGPTPWNIDGTGRISFFFFSIDVDFSHIWGHVIGIILAPIRVMPLLLDELNKLENWQSVLPASNQLLVTLRSFEQGVNDLILHPVGSLKISQRTVPLGMTIDKVGNQKPADANYFEVTVNAGAGLDSKGGVEESFAVGQFFAKSDNELLSAKSFEPMKGGVELSVSGEQYRTPQAVKRVVRYEKIILDTNFKRFKNSFFPLLGSLFDLFLNGNAVSQSVLSSKQQKQLKPFTDKVALSTTLYTVAFNNNNAAFSKDAVGFTSQAQALDFMKQKIAKDANLAKQLHVIPQVEMQKAA